MEKKIAIKVENGREFKALMGYYESMGWQRSTKSCACIQPNDSLFCIIEYGCNWCAIDESNTIAYRNHDVISFATFATLIGIDLPPNEIIVQSKYCTFTVTPEFVYQNWINGAGSITTQILEELYTAYKSLQSLNG